MNARELLEAGSCSPQCLLALGEERGGCVCKCAGRFHSFLVEASVASRHEPDLGVLRVGDCVAIRTPSDCPVGLVTAVDATGIRLSLYSWLIGMFSVGPEVVLWKDVVDLKLTYSFLEDGFEVFQMDGLAQFQNEWKKALDD